MNRSSPGLPVHHQLLEFTQLTSIESVMPSSHLILCCPLLLLPPIPPSIRVFSKSQLFAWGGQSTGVSALASFPPKKSQGWSPSEWTGWIIPCNANQFYSDLHFTDKEIKAQKTWGIYPKSFECQVAKLGNLKTGSLLRPSLFSKPLAQHAIGTSLYLSVF